MPSARNLLSVLAHAGQDDPTAAARAFRAGMSELLVPTAGQDLLPRARANLESLARALREIDAASPSVKKRVLAAAATCIAHDGKVTPAEGELLRAIAASIDCPLPPLHAVDEGTGNPA